MAGVLIVIPLYVVFFFVSAAWMDHRDDARSPKTVTQTTMTRR